MRRRSVLPVANQPCIPGEGGIGNSWFCIELTSEHVHLPGEGGVGNSWFTIELTSDHVPVDEEPTYVPGGPSTAPSRRIRRDRFEDRFPGRYRVIKTDEDRFGGLLIFYKPARFAGIFTVQQSTTQTFSATFDASTLRAIRMREEEEIPFLMDDE